MASYTVKSGDTLSGIAAKFGVDYKQITGYKSGNPNLIYPGENLTIPDKGGVAPPATLANKGQVQNYTNEAQNNFIQSYQPTDAPKVSSVGEIANEVKKLLPSNPAPTPPNMTQVYGQLRQQNNIDSLEAEVADLTAQEDQIIATRRIRTQAEMDKPVAQNVIAGRVSEAERQENERLDAVSRLKARKVDELQGRYQVIDTMMRLTQTDYQLAKEAYDTQYSQAMTMIDLVRGIQKDMITEQQRQIDNARANLSVYANALKEGSIDIANAPPEMRAQLNKLELQAGFPMGFLSSIKKDPKADIVSTTSNNGQIQVLMRNPDGTLSLQTYGTKGGGSVDYTPKQYQDKVTSAISILNDVDTGYRTVNGKVTQAQSSTSYDKLGNKVTTKPTGDRMLSAQEADFALQKVIDSVGGDRQLGEKLFLDAVKGGNFKAWTPK